MTLQWYQGASEEEFALAMYRLQDRCGLTFREAVAVLNPKPYLESLAEQWDVTKEAVHNLSRRGWDKIWTTVGEENWEAVDELVPTHFTHIF